jgi:hypothetical protein
LVFLRYSVQGYLLPTHAHGKLVAAGHSLKPGTARGGLVRANVDDYDVRVGRDCGCWVASCRSCRQCRPSDLFWSPPLQGTAGTLAARDARMWSFALNDARILTPRQGCRQAWPRVWWLSRLAAATWMSTAAGRCWQRYVHSRLRRAQRLVLGVAFTRCNQPVIRVSAQDPLLPADRKIGIVRLSAPSSLSDRRGASTASGAARSSPHPGRVRGRRAPFSDSPGGGSLPRRASTRTR